MDILVIGDYNHPRATCVNWMESIESFPNIEEFDLVIVALNTLTQEGFDQIARKLVEIRSQIFTVFRTGRSVWCIIEKLMIPSPPKSGPKGFVGIPPTNYDWLFAYPTINEVLEGRSIEIADSKFAAYLEKVKKWNLEIENIYELEAQYGSAQPVIAQGLVLEPIAVNKSGKLIGARVVAADVESYGNGTVCLLPKPTECDTHEAVEILIDIATGVERIEPEWRSGVVIPGLSDVEKQMNQLKLDYNKQMNDLQLKWQSLDKYRDVFSVHESPQVESVRVIFGDLGVQTERTKPGFPVDLLGKEVAVEVTSITNKVNADSPKMFQLTQFFEKHRKNEKVILVANTYKREHPSARKGKQDFTPPVIDFLKLRQVCAVTALTLLEIWKQCMDDPSKARKLLLETSGELKL